MAIYICSGGDCGGQSMDVPDNSTSITITYEDDKKRQWIASYELRTHDPESEEKALIYTGRLPVGAK
jgi:hypothetical protein